MTQDWYDFQIRTVGHPKHTLQLKKGKNTRENTKTGYCLLLILIILNLLHSFIYALDIILKWNDICSTCADTTRAFT